MTIQVLCPLERYRLGTSLVKPLPSKAGDSIPRWGAKIQHAMVKITKTNKWKKRQYCNNKDLKNGPHKNCFKKLFKTGLFIVAVMGFWWDYIVCVDQWVELKYNNTESLIHKHAVLSSCIQIFPNFYHQKIWGFLCRDLTHLFKSLFLSTSFHTIMSGTADF